MKDKRNSVDEVEYGLRILKPLHMYTRIELLSQEMADAGNQVSHCWSYRQARGKGENDPCGRIGDINMNSCLS